MNKLTLIGNLTRDPELRTTPQGVSVCSFTVAVNRRKKAEGQPGADYFNITAASRPPVGVIGRHLL